MSHFCTFLTQFYSDDDFNKHEYFISSHQDWCLHKKLPQKKLCLVVAVPVIVFDFLWWLFLFNLKVACYFHNFFFLFFSLTNSHLRRLKTWQAIMEFCKNVSYQKQLSIGTSFGGSYLVISITKSKKCDASFPQKEKKVSSKFYYGSEMNKWDWWDSHGLNGAKISTFSISLGDLKTVTRQRTKIKSLWPKKKEKNY